MILQTVLLLLLVILSIVFIVFQIRASRSFAPWVPSSLGLLRQILTTINPSPGSSFIDLGSGDGRAVFLAAEKFNLSATGVELSPVMWLISRLRLVISPQKKNITLLCGDFYKTNLSAFSIIYCYGVPRTINHSLLTKIRQEAVPSSWIISYNFSFTDLTPAIELRDKWRTIRAYKL